MAKKNFDKILVVDVEATCWEHSPPDGQINEIIEIGICPIDYKTLEIEQHESIIVKPQKSTISEFCTKLTTLTTAQVEKGVLFHEACNLLRNKYKSNLRLWASYGDYDRRQFERQCADKYFKTYYPFAITHINIKNLFAIIQNLDREIGMDRALQSLGYQIKGTHHRAGDDAYNIARILCHLLKNARKQNVV